MRSRALLAPLLGLLLALTGVELAIARGAPAIAGTVVLCGGMARETVTLDVNGDPVRQSQLCPDAIGAFFAATGADAPAVVAPLGLVALCHGRVAVRPVEMRRAPARARGPPASI